jgi:hypothetical protein
MMYRGCHFTYLLSFLDASAWHFPTALPCTKVTCMSSFRTLHGADKFPASRRVQPGPRRFQPGLRSVLQGSSPLNLPLLIKDVERLGHLQHFLDAVLYADNTPTSINAVGSRSQSAFRFPKPICIIFRFRSFLKLCAIEWLQSSSP